MSNSVTAWNPRCFRCGHLNCSFKRFGLNGCIKQICSLKGIVLPFQDIYYHHLYQRMALDILMRQPKLTSFEAAVVRVKRQLFREPKQKPRKQGSQQISRKLNSETECLYYKLQRSEIGRKKIGRKYLDEATPQLCQAMREKLQPKIKELYNHLKNNEAVLHNLKRKRSELLEVTQQLSAENNIIIKSDEILMKARRIRLDGEIKRKTSYKILQASERSICYIDKIMGLIVEDGQIDEDILAM